jgi:hypothetical protein
MVIKIFFYIHISISINKAILIYKDNTGTHLSRRLLKITMHVSKLKFYVFFCVGRPIHYLEKNDKLYNAITPRGEKIDLIQWVRG